MQSLRITLYEIFGYVVPGVLTLIAAFSAIWGEYFPNNTLHIIAPHYNVVVLGTLLLFAYLGGHLIQAVGNIIFTRAEARPEIVADCKHLSNSALQALQSTYESCPTSANFKDVVSLSNAVLSQFGNGGECELYIYREGFYRGAAISALLCAFAVTLRMLHPTLIEISNDSVTIPRSLLFLTAILCSMSAWLFYARFKRFGEYRVRHILSVVTILRDLPKSEQSKKEDSNAVGTNE